MKRINHFLNIVIGALIGVFAGRSIYICWDHTSHPSLYAMQSVPWYTGILVHGALTAALLLAAFTAKFLIRRFAKKA